LIAARRLAAEIARDVPLPGEKGIALHVSGCAKGCAHPAPAPLTIVGTEHGCGVVRNDTARAAPTTTHDPEELIAALRRTESKMREAVHA
jgi:precorrin-3B synthase